MNSMFTLMRTVADIFLQILRNLWAHKLRSFLTMFGIAWGSGIVAAAGGLGEGSARETSARWRNSARTSCSSFPGALPR